MRSQLPPNAMPNLDLLRAVAVTMVVAAHVLTARSVDQWAGLPVLKLGPFGVYLFFVHTSLVLMWSLERRPNPLDFYVRRAFRLYPLAILAILFAAVTHAPVALIDHGSFTAIPITFQGVVLNCLLVNGLIGHAKDIHGVTWSLPPEMFMYLLLPMLFFYARAQKKIWPLLVLWYFAALFAQRIFPASLGNGFISAVPNFLAGIIAYVGFMRRRATLPSWLLLLALTLFLLVWMELSAFPIRADSYCCLALALLLPSLRQTKARWLIRPAHTVAT